MKKILFNTFFFLALPLNLEAVAICNTYGSPIYYQSGVDHYVISVKENTVSFTISLSDYSNYVDDALKAGGLLTTIEDPACIAVTNGDSDWDYPSNMTTHGLGMGISVEASNGSPPSNKTYNPTDAIAYIKMPNTSNNSNFVYSDYSYCPCNKVNGSTCSDYLFLPAINTGYSIVYQYSNIIDPQQGLDLGVCAANVAGMLAFPIRAPIGEIPAIGTYSTKLDITVGPAN